MRISIRFADVRQGNRVSDNLIDFYTTVHFTGSGTVLQELIYTSAPKGLKPGSRGFCTVAATAGIAKNLADQLESLSGYRQLFPPNDPQASLNPVAYSHLLLSVGGQTFHVLSRVAAAGFDYTQRTNKLAHHLAIPRGELPRCGPATLLTVPGNIVESWSGEPRQLPERRLKIALQEGACDYWKTVTGDAGWAGVLATTAIAQQPAVLVYQPGTDMLRLLQEAALLPNSRMRAAFLVLRMR